MFVILGATGRIGGAAAATLRAAGAPVRAVVRDRSKAAHLAELGCEIAVADLNDVAALTTAIEGASAVHVICPVTPQATDAMAVMRRTVDVIASALTSARTPEVLAISDYGAELSSGTGITLLFHYLEDRLGRLPARLTVLRSAEHMENWSRMIDVAARTGVLPSLHHPLDKSFPTVSAFDVGQMAAKLLLSANTQTEARIIHMEGPQRYTSHQVADAVGNLLGRTVIAHEMPQAERQIILQRGGASESYSRLIIDLYDAHNAGKIDARPEIDDIRCGQTTLPDALKRVKAGAGK